MARTTSLLRRGALLPLAASSLVLAALAASVGGCQLVAGLGGEEPLGTTTGGTGGTGGTTSSSGGTGTGLSGPCTPAETETCYGGPEGTQDVGVCKAGSATCGEDGMWGACNGESLPGLELCAASDDENCDGLDCTVWVKTLTGDVYGTAVAVDGEGNIFAAVTFAGGVDFGDGNPVVPVGSSDTALLKYDKTGTLLWKKAYAGADDQSIEDLAVDAAGNIAITGNTSGQIDFGSGKVDPGAFVAKLDATGTAVWARSSPQTGNAYGQHVALDGGGNVFAGGSAASVDFGAGAVAGGDAQNFYVAKFDSASGAPLWTKISKGGGVETLAGMAVDASNSVVLAGSFTSAYLGLDGADDLHNCCSMQVALFLVRLDPDGNKSDGKQLAGNSAGISADFLSLDVDKLGASTLMGSFSGQVSFQSGTYDSGVDQAIFVVRDQTSSFNQTSQAFIQSGAYASPENAAMDPDGNLLITGNYSGPVDFGGGPLPEGGPNKLVLKLDKDGQFLWNRTFSIGDGYVDAMAAGTLEGEVAMVGTFYEGVDFGTGPILAQQGVFVVKMGK